MSAGQRFQPRVRILYEDSRSVTSGFGLHDFVLANVRDVLREQACEVEPHRLRKLIEAIPKNSDTKVLRALEREAERLHGGHTAIVVWLDDDKIHRALGLAPRQPPATLIAAIEHRLPPSLDRQVVRIHLLRGNTEQLLRRLDGAQPGTFDDRTLSEALDKVLTSRDLCFRLAAGERHSAWRGLVRNADPELAETIHHLADLAGRETWPPW